MVESDSGLFNHLCRIWNDGIKQTNTSRMPRRVTCRENSPAQAGEDQDAFT
jgi:hypothetical protein